MTRFLELKVVGLHDTTTKLVKNVLPIVLVFFSHRQLTLIIRINCIVILGSGRLAPDWAMNGQLMFSASAIAGD